jgi:hypothetical protein
MRRLARCSRCTPTAAPQHAAKLPDAQAAGARVAAPSKHRCRRQAASARRGVSQTSSPRCTACQTRSWLLQWSKAALYRGCCTLQALQKCRDSNQAIDPPERRGGPPEDLPPRVLGMGQALALLEGLQEGSGGLQLPLQPRHQLLPPPAPLLRGWRRVDEDKSK